MISIPDYILCDNIFYLPLSCRRKTYKASPFIHSVFLRSGNVKTLTDIEFSTAIFFMKCSCICNCIQKDSSCCFKYLRRKQNTKGVILSMMGKCPSFEMCLRWVCYIFPKIFLSYKSYLF